MTKAEEKYRKTPRNQLTCSCETNRRKENLGATTGYRKNTWIPKRDNDSITIVSSSVMRPGNSVSSGHFFIIDFINAIFLQHVKLSVKVLHFCRYPGVPKSEILRILPLAYQNCPNNVWDGCRYGGLVLKQVLEQNTS